MRLTFKLSEGAADGVLLPAGKLFAAESLPAGDPQGKGAAAICGRLQGQVQPGSRYFRRPCLGRAADNHRGALAKSGPDPAKIRAAIEKTKGFVGIGGVFNYSPTDHDGLNMDAVVMLRVENGQFKFFRR